VRIPPALRFLLAPRLRPRAEQLSLRTDGTSSVVHLLESIGIPRTEVGAVLIDGRPAGRGAIPNPGQVVAVHPVARPQPGADRGFLLDVGLGSLARALRLLGLDAEYANEATDRQLLQRSRDTGRVLLTQDRGLLRRRELPLGALVHGSGTAAQLADVLTRFAPDLRPWTRCPACNGLLAGVEKSSIAQRLEPGTRRSYRDFAECPACGRLYWRGAHERVLSARIAWARDVIAEARARPDAVLLQDEDGSAHGQEQDRSAGQQDQVGGGPDDP
jgi:uncharacterized protein with PIN domain